METPNPLHEPLTIARVPYNTSREFKLFAAREFAGDYGFTLKFLFDFYLGVIGTGTEPLVEQLLNHEERLQRLENREEKQEQKPKTRLNGSTIGG